MKKILREHRLALLGIIGGALVIVTTLAAWSQTAPVLAIAPAGTNLVVTVTNAVSTTAYDLYSTPLLTTPFLQWKDLANGFIGQSNFTVSSGPFLTRFYLVVVDTNSVPLWEAANPTNPGAGVLSVFIDSPTNGTVIP